jgi:predicted aminopeptidase
MNIRAWIHFSNGILDAFLIEADSLMAESIVHNLLHFSVYLESASNECLLQSSEGTKIMQREERGVHD